MTKNIHRSDKVQKDMFSRLFTVDMVSLNLQAASNTEVLAKLVERLYQRGYVKESYLSALLERENKFPTGLATIPFPVAIPHTDSEHVIQPCIAIAKLAQPVPFQEMANETNYVQARFVFLLVLNDGNKQVELLSALMKIFCDVSMMERLEEADSAQAILQVVHSNLG